MKPFSGDTRRSALKRMAGDPLDILVVGGGITGAGVARDAALRGMRVGLVEKGDFGCGTSSRSSKIIHGGVRYLEYLQLGLVRESARERQILCGLAPHLVHRIPFLYPVFEGESLLKIRAGLKLFDLLAGSSTEDGSRRLGPRETRGLLPGLRDRLKGSVLYPEFITDDSRFTLANVRSAAEHGACVANYARVESLLTYGGRVRGALVRDLEGNTDFEVRAAVTVNAAGPWAGEVLTESNLPLPRRLIPSKGIHILFPRSRLPLQAATFLRSSTGRRGLAIPRGPWVYVGTSDTAYQGDLDAVRPEQSEIAELIGMMRDCFPEAELSMRDVQRSWAGVRPLVFEAGKTTREMSRHDRVWISPAGLVTAAGGKLTTYRPMARRILRAVAEARGEALPGEETTHRAPLVGAPGGDIEECRIRTRTALSRFRVSEPTLRRIEFLYGSEADILLQYGSESADWMAPLGDGTRALRGEVRLAIEYGMAIRLPDIMDRRMAQLLFAEVGGMHGTPEAAEIAGDLLGWSRSRKEQEIAQYTSLVSEHCGSHVDTDLAPR